MLLQFNFKNYKSFRDETTLDLTAATVDLKDCFECGDEKVLRLGAVYGANGAGKSNVVGAFESMGMCVLSSFGFSDASDGKFETYRYFPRPFLFEQATKTQKTSFEIYFFDGSDYDKTYNYGFTIDKTGVGEEWFNVKYRKSERNERIFYRNVENKELYLGKLPKTAQANIRAALRKETLLVSLGVKLNVKRLKIVWDFFNESEVLRFGIPEVNLLLSRVINFPVPKKGVQKFCDDVVRFIGAFDKTIVDFKIEPIKSDDERPESFRFLTGCQTNDSDELTYIPLSDESDGTQKMFALYPYLKHVLEKGAVLFVDELNARLHPLLQRSIILTFLNPEINVGGAQLVFTAHEPWLLSCDLLRRDEIWFAQKDASGASSLYSLAEFVDDESKSDYVDEYLYGKFGAIPQIERLMPADERAKTKGTK